jgi:hypothetical protein
MFATPVRIDRLAEADIGRGVAADNAARRVDAQNGLAPFQLRPILMCPAVTYVSRPPVMDVIPVSGLEALAWPAFSSLTSGWWVTALGMAPS